MCVWGGLEDLRASLNDALTIEKFLLLRAILLI